MPIRPLTPELAEKARQELNENPERIPSDLQYLKDWLEKQPHICCRTDDQWLLAFLRGCKYSLERTKHKLDYFHSLPNTTPELRSVNYNDPLFDEILDTSAYIILPNNATPISPRTAIVRLGMYNPEKINIADLFSVVITYQKILMLEDDNAVIGGIQWVVDLEGVTLGHVLQMTPTLLKEMIIQAQDAVPIRMKGLHAINTSAAFQNIINLVRLFLNEKNKNRLFVHNNLEDLLEHIPKHILPKEYGGDGGEMKELIERWKVKRDQLSSWLEEDLKHKTDESKRPGKPKTAGGQYGTEGSFRKINID